MANKYERKATYKPEEVLDFLPQPDDYPKNFKLKTIKKDYDGDEMKMGSDRYYTFAKSLKCAHCNRVGVMFAKERHLNKKGKPENLAYHFNLYAIDPDGEEILMTKDHIVPKARGGRNAVSNYTTMCQPCNHYKMATNEEKAFKDAEERKVNGVLLKMEDLKGLTNS